MAYRERRASDRFQEWLESQVTGGESSMPDHETDRDLAGLREVAGQFHARADQETATDAEARIALPDWNQMMTAYTAVSTETEPPRSARRFTARESSANRATEPAATRFPTTIARQVARWQPVVSFSLVLAVLIGLVGIAWSRNVLSEPHEASNGALIASPTAESDVESGGAEGTALNPYLLPEECVANGPLTSDEDLAKMSLDDWPVPDYSPVQKADPETANRIHQTMLGFQRCLWNDVETWTGTPESFVFSPETQSYHSNRSRFIALVRQGKVPGVSAADANAVDCATTVEDILYSFPLPVNEPPSYAGDGNEDVATLAFFAPSDVYQLPNGRYGAIVGSVSLEALREPSRATGLDSLGLVVFVEKDGAFYFDEHVVLYGPPESFTGRPGAQCPES